MTIPLRWRLTAWYAALLTLVVAAIGAFVAWRLDADLTQQVDRDLRPAAAQIAHDYRQEGDAELRDSAGTVLKGERAAAQLLLADGTVGTSFGDAVARRPLLTAAQRRTAFATGGLVVTRRRGTADFRVAAVPATRSGRRGLVVAAESLAPTRRAVHRVEGLLALAGTAALVLIVAGGWWLARRALRPVDVMTMTAAAIRVDDLEERVPVPRTRDELAHLAQTLNTMLDRIARGVAEQRRLVADASHELRTPLSTMGAEIDVSLHVDDLSPAARAVLLSAREEVDRLGRLVDDLLLLANADDGQLRVRREPVALLELAQAVSGDLQRIAARKAVSIRVDGAGDATADGDPDGLARVIRNLLENSIEFSPPGERVTVTVTPPATVRVADRGPGIPAPLRDRVFDRFFRADPSRSRTTGGSGLGLAIAREIAEANGGRLEVAEGGPGATLILTLPGASSATSVDRVRLRLGDRGSPSQL